MSTQSKGRRSKAGRQRQKPSSTRKRRRAPTYITGKLGLAVAFDVSPSTIGNWIAAGAPKKKSRGYRLSEWITWFSTRADGAIPQQKNQNTDADTGPTELEQARTQREKTKAELDQLRLDNLRGAFVTRAEHERDRSALLRYFAGQLDRLPIELSTLLATQTGQSVKKVVTDHLREVRLRMVTELTRGATAHEIEDETGTDKRQGPVDGCKECTTEK